MIVQIDQFGLSDLDINFHLKPLRRARALMMPNVRDDAHERAREAELA
jgi:hypothetical protein